MHCACRRRVSRVLTSAANNPARERSFCRRGSLWATHQSEILEAILLLPAPNFDFRQHDGPLLVSSSHGESSGPDVLPVRPLYWPGVLSLRAAIHSARLLSHRTSAPVSRAVLSTCIFRILKCKSFTSLEDPNALDSTRHPHRFHRPAGTQGHSIEPAASARRTQRT